MQNKRSILIVDDNRVILQTLELLLKTHFGEIHSLTHPSAIFNEIQQNEFDLILLDMNFKSEIGRASCRERVCLYV